MIDGWNKKEKVKNHIFTPDDYELLNYGDRNKKHALEIFRSFSDQFIPTLSQLITMEKAGLLELEVDGYWDIDALCDVENENQTFELILLRRKK